MTNQIRITQHRDWPWPERGLVQVSTWIKAIIVIAIQAVMALKMKAMECLGWILIWAKFEGWWYVLDSESLRKLVGLEDAVKANSHLSTARRDFLLNRISYWETWVNKNNGPSVLAGGDICGE